MPAEVSLQTRKVTMKALRAFLIDDLNSERLPDTDHTCFLFLLKSSFTGTIVDGLDGSLWDDFETHEADYEGYARKILNASDIGNVELQDDIKMVIPIVEEVFAFGEDAEGETNEIGWVGLVKRWPSSDDIGEQIVAICPIAPTLMNAPGKTLTINFKISDYTEPYPPEE